MLIIFALTALATLCWLLFHLATLALPLVAGICAANLAYHSGAGLLGAGAVGFITGVVTLSAGQLLFAVTRSPMLRAATAVLFAAPAAVVGFSIAHGIMVAGEASAAWAVVFGVIGGAVTGGIALARLSAHAPNAPSGASLPAENLPRSAMGAATGR